MSLNVTVSWSRVPVTVKLMPKEFEPKMFYLPHVQGLRTHHWLYPNKPRELRYVNHKGDQYIGRFNFKWFNGALRLTPVKGETPKMIERNRQTPMTWKPVQDGWPDYYLFGLVMVERFYILRFKDTL
ncbi:hypothetical protein PQC06_gp193 [Aeromonas phage LAh10]|uniref:Uncharacterized protein n=2 Tax=Ludhianavirus TaxID=3044751 RepID=A0A514A1P7_9CAUD|nr:hypothetical protein PQC06_gp193 [Aeromonas phage LAh10]QDH47210.1 hypothetical protein LAh10_192 [Aeromonas phage LAh10]